MDKFILYDYIHETVRKKARIVFVEKKGEIKLADREAGIRSHSSGNILYGEESREVYLFSSYNRSLEKSLSAFFSAYFIPPFFSTKICLAFLLNVSHIYEQQKNSRTLCMYMTVPVFISKVTK